MFCSQRPKPAVAASSLAKSIDAISEQLPHCLIAEDPRKKIETRQSTFSHALKSSIISDCEYTSTIYEWRKVETAPIVKVIELAKRSEIDEATGFACTHNVIQPELIECKLSNFQQFSKEQLLLVLRNMLDGHQAIFKKMKATSVSLEKCVVTASGHVKVWINQQFERNDISGQILTKQEAIIKRIFQTVNFLSSNNGSQKLKDFFDYVESSIQKGGKRTFASSKAMLKSYIDCLRLKVPEAIVVKTHKHVRRQVQSSMVQPRSPVFFSRERKSSFEISNRNIHSSLNCSNYGILNLTSNNISDALYSSFSNNPTSKSIGKDRISSMEGLALKSKHTNSISRLTQAVQDKILESSRHPYNNINMNESRGSQGIHEHRKIPSINDILIKKIGFCSLPEVTCDEECSSPSGKKSKRGYSNLEQQSLKSVSLCIASQFNLAIETNAQQSSKPYKNSSISTTNQTSVSGTKFCFVKKMKQSNMTINLEESKENSNVEEFRTASKDRFKEASSKTEESKKIVGSCTNWSTSQRPFNLSSILQEVKVSKVEDCHQIPKPEQRTNGINIDNQVVSFKNIVDCPEKVNSMTPVKSSKKLIKQYLLKHPLALLNELRSEEQLESYENTQKNSSYDSPSPSMRRIKAPIQEKILQLINLNKKLVISTYMETNSEKKIKQADSPDGQREKRLKDIEETLAELVRANLKQNEIIEGNCWTKRLQNLLGIEEQLKQSISFGPDEANALLRQIKLSRLGKWGREIGNSLIPE